MEVAPGDFETVTVGRILNDRAGFHGRLTRDPIEPDYDGGRTIGKLFLLDCRPTLFSFARGGRSFRLIRAPERIEVARDGSPTPPRRRSPCSARTRRSSSSAARWCWSRMAGMLLLDEHALSYHLAGDIQFWQHRKIGGEFVAVDIDPPARLVRQILSLGPQRRLKPLAAIVTAPTIRPDGSVLSAPGYDAETALLLVLRGRGRRGPARPGPRRGRAALGALMFPFRSFPLVDDFARGGLLAALLTAVVRPALATAPAFAMDAPVQGSGKTLLASCVAALATGHAPEIWPHTASRDDEEIRKRLFAALRDGTTALVWDNITGVFDSAAMAAAITAPVLRDRVLGKSESLGIPNRALLLLTGNNLCPAGDLPRRIITIRIDPGTDAPFARQFDLDPLDYVLDHRMELACAALVLIRGWLSSGAARAEGRMASFEAWDDLVRQTVCWIGAEIAPGKFGDPLELVRRAQGSDPEQESLFALLAALDAVFANGWFTAREACQRAARGRTDHFAAAGEKVLAEALADIAGERALASTKSVGRILKFREGRIVFGLRLSPGPVAAAGSTGSRAIGEADRCGFGGFGGFDSGHSETDPEAASAKSKRAELNPPNPPNPQTVPSGHLGGFGDAHRDRRSSAAARE